MNKLFRFTAAALLVASFGVLGNYTADAAKFLESPREVEIVKPELPEVPQTATVVDQKAHESIIGMTITLPKQAVTAK